MSEQNKGLKNLYQHLIVERHAEISAWHEAYQTFQETIIKQDFKVVKENVDKAKAEKAPSGARTTEKADSYSCNLLWPLLGANNGIASQGQSALGDQFDLLVGNDEFIKKLNGLKDALNSTYNSTEGKKNQIESFGSFVEAWKSAVGYSAGSREPTVRLARLIINRVASAFTTNVSSTPDLKKFNTVYDWLIEEKLIENEESEESEGSENEDDPCVDWFKKNLHLMEQLQGIFSEEMREEKFGYDAYYLSLFVWALSEHLSTPFSLSRQTVKYGAPGTGKTYQAKRQSRFLFEIWKDKYPDLMEWREEDGSPCKDQFIHHHQVVQFHPSFSYEDFLEGIRPDGNGNLVLQNGVFKEFCIKAAKWELAYEKIPNKQKPFDEVTVGELPNSFKSEEKLEEPWAFLNNSDDNLKGKKLVDVIPPFFFIVDEINRAELSRVFGELMYCLEYRGVEGAIKTQYSNLNNVKTGMLKQGDEYKFFIPHNVYLIGTMNNIDRSVESFDFALRRRFVWEEVEPDVGILEHYLKYALQPKKPWYDLAVNLTNLNHVIEKDELLGPDYRIGHAYLMNLKYPTTLTVGKVRERIWDDRIKPLLQEYLRGTGKDKDFSKFWNAFKSDAQ